MVSVHVFIRGLGSDGGRDPHGYLNCSSMLFLLAVCSVLCAAFLELSNSLNNCIHAAPLPTSHVSRVTESSAGRTRANC